MSLFLNYKKYGIDEHFHPLESFNFPYNYHNSEHHPSSCLLFQIRHFGDWILSPRNWTQHIQLSRHHSIGVVAVSGDKG
jgi:hypothetical protein